MSVSEARHTRFTIAKALAMASGLFVVAILVFVLLLTKQSADVAKEGNAGSSIPELRKPEGVPATPPRVESTGTERVHGDDLIVVSGRLVDERGQPVGHGVVLVAGSAAQGSAVRPTGLFELTVSASLFAMNAPSSSLLVRGDGLVDRRVDIPKPYGGHVVMGDVVVEWRIPLTVRIVTDPILHEAMVASGIEVLDLVACRSTGNSVLPVVVARAEAAFKEETELNVTLDLPDTVSVAVRPRMPGDPSPPPDILAKADCASKDGVIAPLVLRVSSKDYIVGLIRDEETSTPLIDASVRLVNDNGQFGLGSLSQRSSLTGCVVMRRQAGFDRLRAEYGDFHGERALRGDDVQVAVDVDLAEAARVRVVDRLGRGIETYSLRPNAQVHVGYVSAHPDLPTHSGGVYLVREKDPKGRWFLETEEGVCRVDWQEVRSGQRGSEYTLAFSNESTGELAIVRSLETGRVPLLTLTLVEEQVNGSWPVFYMVSLKGKGPWTVPRLFPGEYDYKVVGGGAATVRGRVSVPPCGTGRVTF